MYYHQPKRKRFYSYFLPFIIIGLFFAAAYFGWHFLNQFLVEESRSTVNEKVFLNIESGSAKAMPVGSADWQNAPDKIYLYRGERLKTGADGRVTLTFFDQSILRMDTDSEVMFSALTRKNSTYRIETEFVAGNLWAKISRIANPDSAFSLTTDWLTIDTRGAIFAASYPGTVYVMEGNVQVGVKYDDEVIKTYNVGVGQQFTADEKTIEAIKKGEDPEAVFALSDTFKSINWYRWNVKKDGDIDAFEESGSPEEEAVAETAAPGKDPAPAASETAPIANADRLVYVTKPAQNAEIKSPGLKLEGNYDAEKIKNVFVEDKKATLSDDGKWISQSIVLTLEGKVKIKIEAEDSVGKRIALEPFEIVYDKTSPSIPIVTEPVLKEGETAAVIEDVEQIIKGKVSKDTQAVIVNDYRLAKYVPGSETFSYYAKIEYGNLQAGENEYKIYAEDKAGNRSEAAIFVLKLDPEVAEKAKTEKPEETPAENTSDATGTGVGASEGGALPLAKSEGGVRITAPNEGKSFTTSETEFELSGTVPAVTAKVTVNDYALSLYKAGETAFKYRAYASIGNLKIGEKNTYTVQAFDANDDLLGEASITIDVQSGAGAGPVITMPSSEAQYTTTLDTLSLGGTVGKWAPRLYVNDQEVKSYVPGSEKWKMSVKLSPGENVFTVSAEKDGESIGKDTIKVIYKP